MARQLPFDEVKGSGYDGARAVLKSQAAAKPRINVIASLRDLLHDVRLVRNALEAQVDRLDRLEYEIKALPSLSSAGAQPYREWGSTPVARNLMTEPQPDGSVRFAIDGGKSFLLPPRLAEVFQFLASGEKDRPDKDPLVGWRSRRDISAAQERLHGRAITRNYVNGMIYLLRKTLRAAGYNPNLIQTHRQKGVRLAYKRCEPVIPLQRLDA